METKTYNSIEEAKSDGYIYKCSDLAKNPLIRAAGYVDPRSIARLIKAKNHDWMATVEGEGSWGKLTFYKQEAYDYAESLFHEIDPNMMASYKYIEEKDRAFKPMAKDFKARLFENVVFLYEWHDLPAFNMYMTTKYWLNNEESKALTQLLHHKF